MSFPKHLRRISVISGSVVVILIVVSAIILAIGFTINMDGIRNKVEIVASKALGREVNIE